MSAAALSLSQEISQVVKMKPEGHTYRRFANAVESNVKGKNIGEAMMSDIKSALAEFEAIRKGNVLVAPIDMSFGEYANERWGISSLAGVMNLSGIDTRKLTIEQLYSLPNLPADSKAIVPILILDSIDTGYKKPAMYTDFIRESITMKAMEATMPTIKQPDATMQQLNEGETIPMGTISFGGKTARAEKFGRGFTYTDEVIQFSTIETLTPFFEGLGTQLAMSKNALLVTTLMNGVVVIGVVDPTKGFQYEDFLYAQASFDGIGRTATGSLTNRKGYVKVMNMAEVKGLIGSNQLLRVNSDVKTLNTQNVRTHGLLPSDGIMFVDKNVAVRELMVNLLSIESDKIINKQVTEVVATTTLGMTTIFEDGRFLMKSSLDVATNDFPAWMNADLLDAKYTFKK